MVIGLTYNDISLTFDFNDILARTVENNKNNQLAEYEYKQSSQQAFYFIRDIEGVQEGDWILAFNNNIVVGSRQWTGTMTDIPAMGNDGFEMSYGYCEQDDYPVFKLFKQETEELVDLFGDINQWSSNSISIIDNLYLSDSHELPNEITINKIYPNPFNPITTIDFDVPYSTDIKINILNLQGRKVKEIANNEFAPGNYKLQVNALDLSSGIYFVELINGVSAQYSKIILLK